MWQWQPFRQNGEPAGTPFFGNATALPDRPSHFVAVQAQLQFVWPLGLNLRVGTEPYRVQSDDNPLRPWTNQDHVLGMSLALRDTIRDPFKRTSDPNPLRAGRPNLGEARGVPVALANAPPWIAQHYPNPLIAGRLNAGSVWPSLALNAAPFVAKDWPNPQLARRLVYSVTTSNQNTLAVTPAPFVGQTFANPPLPAAVNLGFSFVFIPPAAAAVPTFSAATTLPLLATPFLQSFVFSSLALREEPIPPDEPVSNAFRRLYYSAYVKADAKKTTTRRKKIRKLVKRVREIIEEVSDEGIEPAGIAALAAETKEYKSMIRDYSQAEVNEAVLWLATARRETRMSVSEFERAYRVGDLGIGQPPYHYMGEDEDDDDEEAALILLLGKTRH